VVERNQKALYMVLFVDYKAFFCYNNSILVFCFPQTESYEGRLLDRKIIIIKQRNEKND